MNPFCAERSRLLERDVDGKSNEGTRKNIKQHSLIKTVLRINQKKEEEKEKKQNDLAAVWGHENIQSYYSV